MASLAKCGKCERKYKVPEHLAGKRVRCKCGAVIAMPRPKPVVEVISTGNAIPGELDLSSASGLLSASGFIPEVRPSQPCPSCGAPISAETILCTACGFNTQTGKKVSGVRVNDAGDKTPKAAARKESSRRAARDDGMPSIGARIWKLSKFAIALALLGVTTYYIRGAIRHNPGSEAKEVQTRIYPGMTIEQVLKVTERPPREAWTEETDNKGFPRRVPLHYSESFMKETPPEKLANGFEFVWRYSERAHLHVLFTEEGKVHSSQIVNPLSALGM
jgi:hypothetical protein